MRVPKKDTVLQKLEYLTHAIEWLEKNQSTTRHNSDLEAESPAHEKSGNCRVKRRLDFSEKHPSKSKEGENRRLSPPKKATVQRSASVFDRQGHSSQVPPIPCEQKMRRKEGAPSVAESSVQNTPDELELMKRRLAEMEAKQRSPSEEYTTYRHSPFSFSEDILAKPLPEKLKMPRLTGYKGDNDPVGHFDRYTFWMELQGPVIQSYAEHFL
ncbi:Uncharacterized protein Adt_11194 [Abeliophyllum distichum]|uniref:Uncharacterized protein n=1 Tax=Abeliophyllum distichum TaxID=126358 RepID=A0ABD1UM64_9LAMI